MGSRMTFSDDHVPLETLLRRYIIRTEAAIRRYDVMIRQNERRIGMLERQYRAMYHATRLGFLRVDGRFRKLERRPRRRRR